MATRRDIVWDNVPVTARKGGSELELPGGFADNFATAMGDLLSNTQKMREENANKAMHRALIGVLEDPEAFEPGKTSILDSLGKLGQHVNTQGLTAYAGALENLPSLVQNRRQMNDETALRGAYGAVGSDLVRASNQEGFDPRSAAVAALDAGIDARTSARLGEDFYSRFQSDNANRLSGVQNEIGTRGLQEREANRQQAIPLMDALLKKHGADYSAAAEEGRALAGQMGTGVLAEMDNLFKDTYGSAMFTTFPDVLYEDENGEAYSQTSNTPVPMSDDFTPSNRLREVAVPEWRREGSQYINPALPGSDTYTQNNAGFDYLLNELAPERTGNAYGVSSTGLGNISFTRTPQGKAVSLTELFDSPESLQALHEGTLPVDNSTNWLTGLFTNEDKRNSSSLIHSIHTFREENPEAGDALVSSVDWSRINELPEEERTAAIGKAITEAAVTNPEVQRGLFGMEGVPENLSDYLGTRGRANRLDSGQHSYAARPTGATSQSRRDTWDSIANERFGRTDLQNVRIGDITEYVQPAVKEYSGTSSAFGSVNFTKETLQEYSRKVFGEGADNVAFSPEVQIKIAERLYNDRVSSKGYSGLVNTWTSLKPGSQSKNPRVEALKERMSEAYNQGEAEGRDQFVRRMPFTYEVAAALVQGETSGDLALDISPQQFRQIMQASPQEIAARNQGESLNMQERREVMNQQQEQERSVYKLPSRFVEGPPTPAQINSLKVIGDGMISRIEGTIQASTDYLPLLLSRDASSNIPLSQVLKDRYNLTGVQTQNPEERKAYTTAERNIRSIMQQARKRGVNINASQAATIGEMAGIGQEGSWWQLGKGMDQGAIDAGINVIKEQSPEIYLTRLSETAALKDSYTSILEELALHTNRAQEYTRTRQSSLAKRARAQAEVKRGELQEVLEKISETLNIPLSR